jgi:hypothetical protein
MLTARLLLLNPTPSQCSKPSLFREKYATWLIDKKDLSIVSFSEKCLFNRPLGEICGTSPAQVSFDGKYWISLGSGTRPAFDKMLIRARSGIVALTLLDGSRLSQSHDRACNDRDGSFHHHTCGRGQCTVQIAPHLVC